MTRRRGVSLVEVLVGIGLLAATVVAFLRFSGGERGALATTRERFLARAALAELRAAFGRRSPMYYRSAGLPARVEEADAAHSAAVAGSELVTPPDPDLATGSETRRRFAALLARIEARHVVLYQPAAAAGGEVDVVRYLVLYRDGKGREREVAARELVF